MATAHTAATITRSVHIAAPIERVRAAWPYFQGWLLRGSHRYVCDQIACEDALDAGAVSFDDRGASTVVAFRVKRADAVVSAEHIGRDLAYNLALFKEYVEQGKLVPLMSAPRRQKQHPLRWLWPVRTPKSAPGEERLDERSKPVF